MTASAKFICAPDNLACLLAHPVQTALTLFIVGCFVVPVVTVLVMELITAFLGKDN
jgi:hypothetical protein